MLVAYAVAPVPFNALAGGHWPGLVSYAVAPWILAGLCRLGGDAPFVALPRRPARVIGLGLLVALAAAFAPALLVVVPLIGAGLAAGSALAGRPVAGLRALAASVGATIVAVVLLFPWAFNVLRSRTSLFGVPLSAAGAPRLADVMRFHTGPVGGGGLGWGLLVAAALPLLFGRSWRLAWATRMWGVALCCWLLVWAAGRGFVPVPMADPEVFLAPAAAALAMSVGLGALAFRLDLPGYRLGWRQLASMAAAAGLGLGALPMLGAAAGGRWNLPRQDLGTSLSVAAGSAYRVLWIGDPRALPLGSWQYESGVGYATSDNGPPDVTELWPPTSAGASPLLATDVHLAASRLTTRLGHLLAPMAVRYIVVPAQTAAVGAGGAPVPVPGDVVAGLDQQTDLKARPADEALRVYENAAWVPHRALLSPAAADAAVAANSSAASQSVELAGSPPVLSATSADSFSGALPGVGPVLVGNTYQSGWHLSVAGHPASRQRAFGWAMVFPAPPQAVSGGKASLHFVTPIAGRGLLVLEVALWLVAIGALIGDRRRRRASRASGGVEPSRGDAAGLAPDEAPLALDLSGGVGGHRRPRRVTVPDTGDGDELWT